jgi:putrescine---pyruvate transaminase
MSLDLSEVRAFDNVHWFHPWEELATAGQQNRTVVTGGKGIYLLDENGRKLIDGPGGMWCLQVGYGCTRIAEAIGAQALRMPYMSPYSMTAEAPSRLARKLAELAPGDLDHVFFTTGGSTAVETAIRFVHYANNLTGKPEKKIVISRADSYHGSTYLTASLSGKVGNKSHFDHTTDWIDYVGSVNPWRRPKGMTPEAFCDQAVAEFEQKVLAHGPERVAAFIAEPVQASGGVIVAPDGYLRRVWEICRQHDIVFIADEVVTGFGRLGHWFASKDVFGIEPDIITTAKGLTSGYQPLGACLVSKKLFASISGDNSQKSAFTHGFTYSGHPVACAAALANIAEIEDLDLLAHVREVTPHFQERLHALRAIPIVGDTRGMGLVGCVECVSGKNDRDSWNPQHPIGERIDQHCQELGLIVRPIMNMCVFSPPLIITHDQIDAMFDILEQGVRSTMDDMVREGYWRD